MEVFLPKVASSDKVMEELVPGEGELPKDADSFGCRVLNRVPFALGVDTTQPLNYAGVHDNILRLCDLDSEYRSFRSR